MSGFSKRLAVAAFVVTLSPSAVQAREEYFHGVLQGRVTYEVEVPEGLLQVYDVVVGDFSRVGHFIGYGVQLLGQEGEILWGVAVNVRPPVGESYLIYAADRTSEGGLSGGFLFDGHTVHPEHIGYGTLTGRTKADTFWFRLEGVLSFPD